MSFRWKILEKCTKDFIKEYANLIHAQSLFYDDVLRDGIFNPDLRL